MFKPFGVLSLLLVLTFPVTAKAAVIPLGQTIEIEMPLQKVIFIEQVRACGETINKSDVLSHYTSKNEVLQDANKVSPQPLELNVSRKNSSYTLVCSKDEIVKMMNTTQDRVSGTGTITYMDTETGFYYALGHPIVEKLTGFMPNGKGGHIRLASVNRIVKSSEQNPGYKLTLPVLPLKTAEILSNTTYGLKGPSLHLSKWELPKTSVEKATPTLGKATMLTVIDGLEPIEYSIEIDQIDAKEFFITVTDPRLLEQTGGIIQGMSGSPIMQNGKLVGAITHMNINEPNKGAAIHIQEMM